MFNTLSIRKTQMKPQDYHWMCIRISKIKSSVNTKGRQGYRYITMQNTDHKGDLFWSRVFTQLLKHFHHRTQRNDWVVIHKQDLLIFRDTHSSEMLIGIWYVHFDYFIYCCCSVAKSCPTLCDPMECNTPVFPVLHCLPEFAQTHVHWVGDAI